MKPVVPIILSTLLLTATFEYSYAQKSNKLIDKAERKFEKGKYKQATHLLDRSEAIYEAYCPVSNVPKHVRVDLLRSKICFAQKEYEAGRKFLDSAYGLSHQHLLDSMRIMSYELQYGRDSLCSWVDTSFANIQINCNDGEFFCDVFVPLKGERVMMFKMDPLILEDSYELNNRSNNTRFRLLLGEQNFNRLICKDLK